MSLKVILMLTLLVCTLSWAQNKVEISIRSNAFFVLQYKINEILNQKIEPSSKEQLQSVDLKEYLLPETNILSVCYEITGSLKQITPSLKQMPYVHLVSKNLKNPKLVSFIVRSLPPQGTKLESSAKYCSQYSFELDENFEKKKVAIIYENSTVQDPFQVMVSTPITTQAVQSTASLTHPEATPSPINTPVSEIVTEEEKKAIEGQMKLAIHNEVEKVKKIEDEKKPSKAIFIFLISIVFILFTFGGVKYVGHLKK
jgi:hypothetical protein